MPTSKFDEPARTWRDIPGWFQWRRHQEEAAAHFPDGSWFVEVGCYLGRSICLLGEVVREVGLDAHIVGVDTAQGSGPEGRDDTGARARRRARRWNVRGATAPQHHHLRLGRHDSTGDQRLYRRR